MVRKEITGADSSRFLTIFSICFVCGLAFVVLQGWLENSFAVYLHFVESISRRYSDGSGLLIDVVVFSLGVILGLFYAVTKKSTSRQAIGVVPVIPLAVFLIVVPFTGFGFLPAIADSIETIFWFIVAAFLWAPIFVAVVLGIKAFIESYLDFDLPSGATTTIYFVVILVANPLFIAYLDAVSEGGVLGLWFEVVLMLAPLAAAALTVLKITGKEKQKKLKTP